MFRSVLLAGMLGLAGCASTSAVDSTAAKIATTSANLDANVKAIGAELLPPACAILWIADAAFQASPYAADPGKSGDEAAAMAGVKVLCDNPPSNGGEAVARVIAAAAAIKKSYASPAP